MPGATDRNECTTLTRGGNCRCQKCSICGQGKHAAIHGPIYGQPPGSKPCGHQFTPSLIPEPETVTTLDLERDVRHTFAVAELEG